MSLEERPPFAPETFAAPTVEEWCRVTPAWFPDSKAKSCFQCNNLFYVFMRRHHCRLCGGVFCDQCCQERVHIPLHKKSKRACVQCRDRVRATSLEGQELSIRSPRHHSRRESRLRGLTLFCEPEDLDAKCYWNELPADVITKIFCCLREPFYFGLFLVCSGFHDLADSDKMWQTIYCRRWNVSASVIQIRLEWKRVYKKKHQSEINAKPSEQRMSMRPPPRRPNRQTLARSQMMSPLDISAIENMQTIKIVVLGSFGAGKTAAIRALQGYSFEQSIPSTVGAALSKWTLPLASSLSVKLDIWELSGKPKYHNLGPLYFEGAHAFVFVYDLASLASYEDCIRWIEAIDALDGTGSVSMVLATKQDCVADFSPVTPQNAPIRHRRIQYQDRVNACTGQRAIIRAFETLATLVLTQRQQSRS